MKSLFLRFLILVSFACACAFAQGSTGTTITTTTTNFVFPPVGLAQSETAAVSLVNIAPVPASTTATASSCTGTVTFANSTGTVIGKAMPFTVTSGQIATESLTATAAGITAARGEILVSVQQTTTRPATAPCSLVFSLSTFDTGSGATHLFLGNTSSAAQQPVIPEPMR